MNPRVNTHERVRRLQPCEERERQVKLERRKDVRAVATGYLANPSIQLDKTRREHALAILSLADALRTEMLAAGIVVEHQPVEPKRRERP